VKELNKNRILYWLLLFSAVISVISLLTLIIFVVVIPFGNLTVLRLTITAAMDGKFAYLIIGCLLILFLFIAFISVKRGSIILPIFTLVFYLFDLVQGIYIFIVCLQEGFFEYISLSSSFVDMAVIVFFAFYFLQYYKKIRQNKRDLKLVC
jgi:hypothetical protein